MELTLHRKWKKNGYSIGLLYVNGVYLCDTLEDTDRGLDQSMTTKEIQERKVYCETAIPYGRYEITMKVQSPKYKTYKQYQKCKGYLPRLKYVKGYEGVLMHIGNYPKDSCGCILVGKNEVKGAVVNSTLWFWKLYDLLKEASDRGEKIYITIHP